MTELTAPPPLDAARTALFLDFDGTLAPLAARPELVMPDAGRNRLIASLSVALGGALAIVSGRALADLDRLLGFPIAVAAVHGLVRRLPDGAVTETALPIPAAVRGALKAFAAAHPAILVEDKGPAVALHYRAAPELRDATRAVVQKLAADHRLVALDGDMVAELRVHGPDKGVAAAAFMADAPFADRTPIFVGDDFTDEHGFEAASALGGYGVIVGARRPTAAKYALTDVDAVVAWLAAAVGRRQKA